MRLTMAFREADKLCRTRRAGRGQVVAHRNSEGALKYDDEELDTRSSIDFSTSFLFAHRGRETQREDLLRYHVVFMMGKGAW